MTALFYKAAGAILAPFRYAEREVQQLKETAKEDLQTLVANAIKYVAMGLVGLLFLVFLSTAAAWGLNEAMDSSYMGHLIVAGFYLLVGVGLYIWKSVADKRREEEKRDTYTRETQQILHRKTVGA